METFKERKSEIKKFVRYSEGAKAYSMGLTKFQELAKDAKACYNDIDNIKQKKHQKLVQNHRNTPALSLSQILIWD